MFGPVLQLELLLGSRRGRQRLFRWLYLAWLIVQFSFFFLVYRAEVAANNRFGGLSTAEASSRFADNFIDLLLGQQFLLILVLTPAFAAGAITDEKTRGTLQYLLCAEVTGPEIAMGKLLGRVAQLSALLIVSLPLMCFVGPFGGLTPVMIVAAIIASAGPLFAIAALSLLMSVWCRQTRDAVLAVYSVAGALFLVRAIALDAMTGGGPPGQVQQILEVLSPLGMIAPGRGTPDYPRLLMTLTTGTLIWGGFGLICFALAAWRLRPAAIKQLESKPVRLLPRLPGFRRAPVGDDPIEWKARQYDGIAPLPILRFVPMWIAWPAIAGLVAWTSFEASRAPAGQSDWYTGLTIMVCLLAAGIVGIKSSGVVSGEREKQTWEALLLTPIETRALISGKLWGTLAAGVLYLVAYAIPAVMFSSQADDYSLIIVATGLGVTALACYFMAAAGVYCSVTSRSSWRALLGTLAIGYGGGFALFVVSMPVMGIVALLLWLLIVLIDLIFATQIANAFGNAAAFYVTFMISMCVGMAISFVSLAIWFHREAVRSVSQRERVRIYDVPKLRRVGDAVRIRRLRPGQSLQWEPNLRSR